MTSPPTVSILMAVKNEELHIRQALESLLGQTYGQFEVLVCNDHSSDETEAIVEALACADPRIRLLQNSGSGKTAAYNTAFAAATGDYYTFMGGDDYLPAGSLRARVDRIEATRASVVVCGYTTVSDDRAFDNNVRLPTDGPGLSLWSGGLILFGSDFARVLFPLPEGVPSEDGFAYYLAFAEAFRIEGLAESEYFYRIHEGNSYSKTARYADISKRFEIDLFLLEAAASRLENSRIPVPPKIGALRAGRERSLRGASVACLYSAGLSGRERLRFYWQSDPRVYNTVRRLMSIVGHK